MVGEAKCVANHVTLNIKMFICSFMVLISFSGLYFFILFLLSFPPVWNKNPGNNLMEDDTLQKKKVESDDRKMTLIKL